MRIALAGCQAIQGHKPIVTLAQMIDQGWQRVCSMDDVRQGAARGFRGGTTDNPIQILIISCESQLHAYHNRCPHTGVPLDWTPDQFFDTSGKFIQCSTHGALFEPITGLCVAGPCAGDFLTRVETRIVDGLVEIRLPSE